jgi:hypothetical protein
MNAFFPSLLVVLVAAVPLRAASGGYEWRSFPDDKDQISLWREGVQVGNYRLSEAAYYPRLGPGRWGNPCPPPCPPPSSIERDGTLNYGLDTRRIKPAGKHQLNGRDVSREEILEALGDTGVRDDRDQLFITIIGGASERRQVLDDLANAPALAGWKGRLKVHDYEPAHWAVKDAGFKTDGRPTIYVQAPDGKVLHRQDDYRGPQALAEALRKADPRYQPDKDPDLNRSLASVPPPVWIGVALLVALLFGKGDDQ